MELKDLLTYNDPEEQELRKMEEIKEQLKENWEKLTVEEREIVQESMFMDFIGSMENEIGAFIRTNYEAGVILENDGYIKTANRCFKKILESGQRKDAEQREKDFLIMFIKAMGQVINDTYNIKKIYFDNN
jgi:hypothetical protein